MRISEKYLHVTFVIGILLKALNGVLEIVLGAAFLFTSALTGVVVTLIRGELIEDPTDLIANILQHSLPFLTHSQYFISFYLLSHGIIKIFLVMGLLRNMLWAYPAALVIFVLFIVNQMYRYAFTHSPWLVVLSVFDLFVVVLTWHEYRLLRRKQRENTMV